MATTMTPQKAASIALGGLGALASDEVDMGEAFIEMLPENCLLITDVAAFRDVLVECYGATIVSDSGNRSHVIDALPEPLRRGIADLIEVLEV